MHIKAIKISGFRSYREQTIIDDFSRRFNVVVGQNGSGKSNFFAAIEFVLSTEVHSLSMEVRQAMLHEGAGSRSAQAQIDLVFDNTDRRLVAVDANEFTISRQISAKKDSYLIDGRPVTKAEVTNLMESAGFSRSNPYYIIRQGKITELANASDNDRLKLLREIAGTRVYDDKKKESIGMLEETKAKMEKSLHLLDFMDQRLQTLESEKEELKEYQQHDKLRRALEYALLKNEVNDCKKEFDNLSKQRYNIQTVLNEAEVKKFDYSKKMTALETDLRALEVREKSLAAELASCREEEARLEAEKTLASLESKDLQDLVDQEQGNREHAEEKLEELEAVIASKERELAEIRPRYTKLVQKQEDTFGELNVLKRTRAELYAKSGGDKTYKSVEERDRALKQKIMHLNQRIEDTRDHIAKFEQALEEERNTKAANDQRIQEIEIKIDSNKVNMDNLTHQDGELRATLDKLVRDLYHRQTEHKSASDRLAEQDVQYNHIETSFYQMLPKSTAEGIRNINTIYEELKLTNTNGKYDEYINGYHGIVIKLMSADSSFFKALEVTAGSTLTHHVVDNERIAMFYLDQINQRNMKGQATFYALNRVYASDQRPLRDNSGRHLLSVIQYEGKFLQLFRSIFGGTILVRDIAVGRTIARNERFNCVTFDGDEISFGGPMSGGYIDSRKSKLETIKSLTNLEPTIQKIRENVDYLARECSMLEKSLNEVRMKLSANEQDRALLQRSHDNITAEKRELFELNNRLRMNMEDKEQQLITVNRSLRDYITHRDQLSSQIGTPLASASSSQETREITELDEKIKEQTAIANDILNQVSDLRNRKNRLENELSASLLRQREDLKMKVSAMNFEVKRHELNTRTAEISKIQQRVSEVYNHTIEVSEELDTLRSDINEKRAELHQLSDQKAEADSRVASNTAEIEQLRRRMGECNQRRDDTVRKLKDLGTLPYDISTNFGNMKRKDLEAKWMESLNQMKKYTNVNKKALDQFVRSSTERDSLHSQIEEQQANYDRIKALIDNADRRKNDDLMLTFKQVANNFHNVFHKLVPNGVGNLIMKVPPADQNDPDTTTHVFDRFIGVGIKVNFHNDSQEGCKDLYHLSGGQKTLVAMALIFAIQKCDPAPFYLFDEIDAALDQEKRRAVAKLIDEFSTNAQFIATTFRREMLDHANKCYGVRFRNKVSYITAVSAEEARDFLSLDEEEPNDDDAMEIQ